MIYWVTNSITSSIRFYRENGTNISSPSSETINAIESETCVKTGVANFPGNIFISNVVYFFVVELSHTSRNEASSIFKNIVHWENYDRGGHFVAREEPDLLASDICIFCSKI